MKGIFMKILYNFLWQFAISWDINRAVTLNSTLTLAYSMLILTKFNCFISFWIGSVVSNMFCSQLINISIDLLISSVFNGITYFPFDLALCENLPIQASILIVFQNSNLLIRSSTWLSLSFAVYNNSLKSFATSSDSFVGSISFCVDHSSLLCNHVGPSNHFLGDLSLLHPLEPMSAGFSSVELLNLCDLFDSVWNVCKYYFL